MKVKARKVNNWAMSLTLARSYGDAGSGGEAGRLSFSGMFRDSVLDSFNFGATNILPCSSIFQDAERSQADCCQKGMLISFMTPSLLCWGCCSPL